MGWSFPTLYQHCFCCILHWLYYLAAHREHCNPQVWKSQGHEQLSQGNRCPISQATGVLACCATLTTAVTCGSGSNAASKSSPKPQIWGIKGSATNTGKINTISKIRSSSHQWHLHLVGINNSSFVFVQPISAYRCWPRAASALLV